MQRCNHATNIKQPFEGGGAMADVENCKIHGVCEVSKKNESYTSMSKFAVP